MNHNQEVGLRGEEIAAKWLEQQGMIIVERNWHGKHGELDIVALDGPTLRIVEVKTRIEGNEDTLSSSLNSNKLRSICRTAQEFLVKSNGLQPQEVYFDLIVVLFTLDGSWETEYIPCFFYPQW